MDDGAPFVCVYASQLAACIGRNRHRRVSDAVLAMYHDQGLPVLKYASFGAGVNVTLRLPIIRTSVDHGTALDIAGTGKADAGSLLEAARLAIELAQGRHSSKTVQAAARA